MLQQISGGAQQRAIRRQYPGDRHALPHAASMPEDRAPEAFASGAAFSRGLFPACVNLP
jgi:hypothetical protein